MTTLIQCEGCGRWLAAPVFHECPMDRPRRIVELPPIDTWAGVE
jgi:hypothetical protein